MSIQRYLRAYAALDNINTMAISRSEREEFSAALMMRPAF